MRAKGTNVKLLRHVYFDSRSLRLNKDKHNNEDKNVFFSDGPIAIYLVC